MTHTLKVPHFWIILAIMVCGAVLYYGDQIPVLQTIMTQAPLEFTHYSVFRILSIIPVAYAAFVFHFRGGVITAIFVSLALLPRPLLISPHQFDALAETAGFLCIGLLVSWLIDRQQRTVSRLENTRQELSDSLESIKNEQQQLQFCEDRYRGLFENASEAILACSTTGRIISVNRACEQLTGYTQSELSTTTIYELFSGMSIETVKELFSGKLERITVGETEELHLIRKDGTEVFIQLKAGPLLRGDQVIGLQAIARNVTEERQLRQNMEYYIAQITRAQEDERLRISRELHDDTVQVLAGLSRDLGSLLSTGRKLPKPTIETLEKLREMADSSLEGVRRFSQDLRPSVLDDLGLVPALKWLTTDLEKQHRLAVKVSINGIQRRLPPEKELTVFRIAQEALNNVARHSQASAVEMTVDFSDDALTLIISDNGQGFDMPTRTSDLVQSAKLGIVGMRERARLIGGTLIVQSEVGVGTTVTLRIPG